MASTRNRSNSAAKTAQLSKRLHRAGIGGSGQGYGDEACGSPRILSSVHGTQVTSLRIKKKSGPYKVGKRRSSVSSVNNILNNPTNNGYGATDYAVKGDEYLALVVMRTRGTWGYVRINRDNIDVCDNPVSVIPAHHGHLMMDLWKRVVQHGAIPWTDEVLTDTLRIVKFKQDITDVTFDFMGEQVDQIIRTNALAKLTDEEAEVLGIAHEKRKQTVMYDPNFTVRDKKLLSDLNNSSAIYDLSVSMSDVC